MPTTTTVVQQEQPHPLRKRNRILTPGGDTLTMGSSAAAKMLIIEPRGHPLQQLPDLTDRLKSIGAHDDYLKYKNDYMKWRQGGAKGAGGEITDLGDLEAAGGTGPVAVPTPPSPPTEVPVVVEASASPFLAVMWGSHKLTTRKKVASGSKTYIFDCKAILAEFVVMALFVFFGCGAACSNGAGDSQSRLLVASTFGWAIVVLAYSAAHHSGGHINCAVTLSLVIAGITPWYQGIAYLIVQLLGSLVGAAFLAVVYSCDTDKTGGLGSNVISDEFSTGQTILAEIFGTFFLCYTVFENAVSAKSSSGKNACLVIGLSVFVAHTILLPIDGCSINPTRSFGPAIISATRKCGPHHGMRDLWVMWVGPCSGAILAALAYQPFSHAVVIAETPSSDDEKSSSSQS